ncbi:MAG: ATP synthase F0 subunit C [Deltaproteobacteria bacterium]|nr:ATP synthase F0 subunit C [Deltaproteobacteria bacterium]
MNRTKMFWGFLFALLVMAFSGVALAGEGGAAALEVQTWIAISAPFGIAIAAFGGAFGQGRAASAALEGIARNPGAASKIQTPMIIALALIESLVIYAFVIAIMFTLKVG